MKSCRRIDGENSMNVKRILGSVVLAIIFVAAFFMASGKANAADNGEVYVHDQDQLYKALIQANLSDVPTTIVVMRDIEYSGDRLFVDLNSDITIDLLGHTITVTEKYKKNYLFQIVRSKLRIMDSSPEKTGMISGGDANRKIDFIVCPYVGNPYGDKGMSHYEFILDSGTICNFRTAVYLDATGDFIMNGGTIKDCENGVYVTSGTNFTMNGGCIEQNKLTEDSYFLKEHEGDDFYAAGVVNRGECRLNGGEITDNVGRGVYNAKDLYIGKDVYIKNNTDISGNRAANVYLAYEGKVHVTDSTGPFIGISSDYYPKGTECWYCVDGEVTEEMVNSRRISSDKDDYILNYKKLSDGIGWIVLQLKKPPLEGTVRIKQINNNLIAEAEYISNFYTGLQLKCQWYISDTGEEGTWAKIDGADKWGYEPDQKQNGKYIKAEVYDNDHSTGSIYSNFKKFIWNAGPVDNLCAVWQFASEYGLEPRPYPMDDGYSVEVILCEDGDTDKKASGTKSYSWYTEDGTKIYDDLAQNTFDFTEEEIGKKLYCEVTYKSKTYTTDLIGPVEKKTVRYAPYQEGMYEDRIIISNTWPGAEYLLVPYGSEPKWSEGCIKTAADYGMGFLDLPAGTSYNLYYRYEGTNVYREIEETLSPKIYYTKDLPPVTVNYSIDGDIWDTDRTNGKGKLNYLSESPAIDNCTFLGWYKDPEFKEKVTKDMVLYSEGISEITLYGCYEIQNVAVSGFVKPEDNMVGISTDKLQMQEEFSILADSLKWYRKGETSQYSGKFIAGEEYSACFDFTYGDSFCLSPDCKVVINDDASIAASLVPGDGKATVLVNPIKCMHANLMQFKANAATCTADGNSEYYYCEKCGKYYSDAEGKNEIAKDSWIIKASHKWEADYTIDKEATCTAQGSKSIHCSACDAKKDITSIPMIAHKDNDKDGKCDACGSTLDGEPGGKPDGAEFLLLRGQKTNITERFASVKLAEGEKIAGYYIKDKKEKKLASVNKKGVLTPKKPGVIHVTAYKMDGKKKADVSTIELKILAPAFDKKAMTATYAGQTVKADALLSDFAAAAYGQTVTWKSSKTKVATVDEITGLITAIKNGKTVISAKFTNKEGKSVTVKATFTVKIPKLNVKDTLTLKAGKLKKLSVGNIGKDDAVTWQSSNADIVSIEPNGKKAVIKALATGSSEITASVNGHSYKVIVSVP